MPIASINPATGETLKTFEPLSETQIDEKLQRAADTFFATYRRNVAWLTARDGCCARLKFLNRRKKILPG